MRRDLEKAVDTELGREVSQSARRGRPKSKLVSSWNRAWRVGLPFLTIVLVPKLAHACAVCFSGRSDETRQAFIGTTAFMTFLPLILIGGLTWFLRRRFLAMQAQDRADRVDAQRRVGAD